MPDILLILLALIVAAVTILDAKSLRSVSLWGLGTLLVDVVWLVFAYCQPMPPATVKYYPVQTVTAPNGGTRQVVVDDDAICRVDMLVNEIVPEGKQLRWERRSHYRGGILFAVLDSGGGSVTVVDGQDAK